MSVLEMLKDGLLGQFQWYRQYVGGTWYGYNATYANYIWERNINSDEIECFGKITIEDYTKEEK